MLLTKLLARCQSVRALPLGGSPYRKLTLRLDTLAMLDLLANGPLIQRDLAVSLGVDKVSVCRWTQSLCKSGYVVRRISEVDRRKCTVAITALGVDELARAGRMADERLAELD